MNKIIEQPIIINGPNNIKVETSNVQLVEWKVGLNLEILGINVERDSKVSDIVRNKLGMKSTANPTDMLYLVTNLLDDYFCRIY